MGKICILCKQEKDSYDFPKNKRAKDGLHSYCIICNRQKSLNYIRTNPEARKRRRADIRKMMIEAAQSRAVKKGLDIDIVYTDILVPDECPVFKQPIRKSKGKANEFSPSLDRIDNSKGYIKGNIQVISNKANAMKGNSTIPELIQFAKWVLKEYDSDV